MVICYCFWLRRANFRFGSEKNYVDLELTNLITLTYVLTGSGTEAAHSAWVTIPHCLPEASNDERFPNKTSVLGSHSLPEEARVGGNDYARGSCTSSKSAGVLATHRSA